MPSSTLQSASPGFLRDFNFSTLTQAIIEKMFGGAERPSWMRFSITSRRDERALQIVFKLCVDIEPERRVNFSTSGFRVGPSRRKRGFDVEFEVADPVIRGMRAELPELFIQWLESAMKRNAHKFYELDPRIGWRRVKKGDELPVSPLFDPPERFSRDGFPWWTEAPTAVEESGIEPRCPFCREVHEEEHPPIWGGANLMWVHTHCWRGP